MKLKRALSQVHPWGQHRTSKYSWRLFFGISLALTMDE
jgi:hypothetical protein